MTELQIVARSITEAVSYVDIFGQQDKTKDMRVKIKRIYRKLAIVVHPDHYSQTAEKKFAEQVFARLSEFYSQAMNAIEAGVYGATTVKVTIQTRRATHEVRRTLAGGDITATHETVSRADGVTQPTFCKVARHACDNDLVKNEAHALKRLHSDAAEEKWKRHIPVLVDSFLYSDNGPRLRANVLSRLDGFYSATQIRKVYPGGVDVLDAIWIFRRLLMALGFTHDNGVVHGAVVPEHVMIHPGQHGVVLIDWCYASVDDDGVYPPIKALAKGYREWYPEEVFAKNPPSAATDIAMAVRSTIELLGGNPITGFLPHAVRRELRAFFRGCLLTRQAMRPQNAWLLLEEFDELLRDMRAPFYPLRFHQFTVPSGAV